MGWLKRGFKNAFAVDPPGPAQPTPEQQTAVDWVCRQIAMRRLTTPGLIFLEMWRPMNWLSAQFMHVVQPAAWALLQQKSYDSYVRFSEFLEHRGSMEYMCRRIEELEAEYERREKGKGRKGSASSPSSSPDPPQQNSSAQGGSSDAASRNSI